MIKEQLAVVLSTNEYATDMQKEINAYLAKGWQDGRVWPNKHCFESPTDYYNETFKSE